MTLFNLLKGAAMTTLPRTRPQSGPTFTELGFTLIELSIVLVIIGLIVGGVLVGQDLIRAAEIRATVGQVEKYNAAVNTFRTKYNGIPGDLIAAQATSANCTGATGLGDGNGVVGDSATGGALGVGEPILFWQELSNANLMDGSLGQAVTTAGASAALTSSNLNTVFPAAKMGRGNTWFVGNNGSGQNFYLLGGASAMTTGGVYVFTLTLTPIESYNIDVKLDDGAPTTGIVQARGALLAVTAFGENSLTNGGTISAAPTSGTCELENTASETDPLNSYARGTASGSSPGCMLRFRFN
jgi:prepilin-type N-terminal cleavage/methylation domain-containing protein